MGLHYGQHSLVADSVMAHKRPPYPTSMFDADGHMLEAKTKANLKNSIKVEISSTDAENGVDYSCMDGCDVVGSTLTDIWHSARLSGPMSLLHTWAPSS